VLSTTANPVGRGLLLDMSKVGYVAVQEALSMRIGFTYDDFTRNIVRTVAEERLVLCVTRQAAARAISSLPLSWRSSRCARHAKSHSTALAHGRLGRGQRRPPPGIEAAMK
jgi:hypothetical protein